jgi:hypothetical protein
MAVNQDGSTYQRQGEAGQGQGEAGSSGDDMLPPTQAVVYGAVGHLAPAERTQYSAHLEQGGVSRLSDCLLAWSQATDLDRDSFRHRFLGGAGSDVVVDHLREAATGASSATTAGQQRDAASELAHAWRLVGADRWPRFIADAHDRAMSNSAMAGARGRLAQAITPTDAGAGVHTVGEAATGRYVADNPRQWIGHDFVGTGECAPLVEKATGAPPSKDWRRGVPVRGNANIRPGTAIATFDNNGRYGGHAAIYLGQDHHGLRVIDQWNRWRDGSVMTQHWPGERVLALDDPWRAGIDRAELFHVVE